MTEFKPYIVEVTRTYLFMDEDDLSIADTDDLWAGLSARRYDDPIYEEISAHEPDRSELSLYAEDLKYALEDLT